MDISEHPGAAGRRVQAEALRAGFERLVAQAPAIHAEALQVEVTRESWDGLVAATVGAQGELIALDIDPRVYRHPDARALADTIVETVRSATAAVRDRVVELFAPLVDEEQMRMHLDGDLEGVLDRLTQQLHGEGVTAVPDDLAIRPTLLAAGAARRDAADAALDATWEQGRGPILALSTERTWGSDGPGTAFAGSFLQDGGPAQVLFGTGPTGGQQVVTALGEAGRALTESVAQLTGTDHDAAAGIAAINGA